MREGRNEERDSQELIGDSSLSNSWITIKNDQSAVHIDRRRLMIGFCRSEVQKKEREWAYIKVMASGERGGKGGGLKDVRSIDFCQVRIVK